MRRYSLEYPNSHHFLHRRRNSDRPPRRRMDQQTLGSVLVSSLSSLPLLLSILTAATRYEKSATNRTFIGYCTCYGYYLYNPKSPYTSRLRISQFLRLSLFQHQGHGKNLYNSPITRFLTIPSIQEITVEDPGEAFPNLRNIQYLHQGIWSLAAPLTISSLLGATSFSLLP